MDNLLALVTSERAQELQLHAGSPPVIVLGDEPHSVEGPPITTENVEQLFRSIATSREMRELRTHGGVEFIYNYRRSSPFLVSATLKDGRLCMTLR